MCSRTNYRETAFPNCFVGRRSEKAKKGYSLDTGNTLTNLKRCFSIQILVSLVSEVVNQFLHFFSRMNFNIKFPFT